MCLLMMLYIKCKMSDLKVFLLNQIAEFFDYQYLWKEAISSLELFHRHSSQER